MLNKKAVPFGLVVVGLLFVIGAFYLLGNNNSQNVVPESQADIPEPQITRVTLLDSKAAYDSGDAIFIDVRDSGSYSQNHIPGAISIPLAELGERLGELNSEDWHILYCT